MHRVIDETYLTVHPATALWWEQRAKCEACAFSQSKPLTPDFRCTAWPVNTSKRNGKNLGFAYCIEERSAEGRCGPLAQAWKPRPEGVTE